MAIVIGNRIWQLMAQQNIRTITELSRRSGISRVTLSKIVNGKVESVSLSTLIGLSRALNVPVEQILDYELIS